MRMTPTADPIVGPRKRRTTTVWDVKSADVADVVAAATLGDARAWDELVDRFGALLWSIARSYRLDTATCADVVQEAWVRLAQSLDRIREPSSVGAWLATTTRNEALRVAKKQQRERPDRFDDESQLGLVGPADGPTLARERDQLLVDCLTAVPERCQQLLRLLVAEPAVPYTEIAEILDMPVGSIGPTRSRCLRKLRESLEQRDNA